VADGVSGYLYSRIGLKKSLGGSFFIGAFGGLAVLINGAIYGWDSAGYVFPILVIFSKFGLAGAFNIVYVCNIDVFPTLFQAGSLGIVNFLARVATILAP